MKVVNMSVCAYIVSVESLEACSNPYLARVAVVIQSVDIVAHAGNAVEDGESRCLPVVDVDAPVLCCYPEDTGLWLYDVARNAGFERSRIISGLEYLKLLVVAQQIVNASEVRAYPYVAVAVEEDRVDGIVAERVDIVILVLQDFYLSVGMDDGDALLCSEPYTVQVVFGDTSDEAA